MKIKLWETTIDTLDNDLDLSAIEEKIERNIYEALGEYHEVIINCSDDGEVLAIQLLREEIDNLFSAHRFPIEELTLLGVDELSDSLKVGPYSFVNYRGHTFLEEDVAEQLVKMNCYIENVEEHYLLLEEDHIYLEFRSCLF